LTSQAAQAELVGAAMNGIVAGSPALLHTGQPLYSTEPPAVKLYNQIIDKYATRFDSSEYTNGTTTVFAYANAEVTVDALRGALAKYGSGLTEAEFISYTQGMKNIETVVQPVMASFSPSCKTGADGTIWGYWHYDAATKVNTFVPDSGSSWVTEKYLGLSPCYLTQFANKYYSS
jgi:hypothetical protein